MQNSSHTFIFPCLVTLTIGNMQHLSEQLNYSLISLYWNVLYFCLCAAWVTFLVLFVIMTKPLLKAIRSRKDLMTKHH